MNKITAYTNLEFLFYRTVFRIRCQFYADPDPVFYCRADQDTRSIGLQKIVPVRIRSHVIMQFRIRSCIILLLMFRSRIILQLRIRSRIFLQLRFRSCIILQLRIQSHISLQFRIWSCYFAVKVPIIFLLRAVSGRTAWPNFSTP